MTLNLILLLLSPSTPFPTAPYPSPGVIIDNLSPSFSYCINALSLLLILTWLVSSFGNVPLLASIIWIILATGMAFSSCWLYNPDRSRGGMRISAVYGTEPMIDGL